MRSGVVAVIIVCIVTIVMAILLMPVPCEKVVEYPVSEVITKTQTLFEGHNLYISTFGYRYSGPYYLEADQTITVTWDADSIVNVYIMNEVDWGKRFFGAPTSFRAFKSSTSGSLSYTLRYDEPVYVQVMTPTLSSAKLYAWKETISWQEQVTVYEHRVVVEYRSLLSVLMGGCS